MRSSLTCPGKCADTTGVEHPTPFPCRLDPVGRTLGLARWGNGALQLWAGEVDSCQLSDARLLSEVQAPGNQLKNMGLIDRISRAVCGWLGRAASWMRITA